MEIDAMSSPRRLDRLRLNSGIMSLAQLKDEAAHLPSAEQRELTAFLIARQTAEDEELQRTLAEKIENKDPSRWVDLDDLERRFKE